MDVVIGGNIHVYARGEAQGVHSFVTGATSDRPIDFLPAGAAMDTVAWPRGR